MWGAPNASSPPPSAKPWNYATAEATSPAAKSDSERCQAHHIQDWAKGGPTSLANDALLCHAHHRQVDLGLWTIQPGEEHHTTNSRRLGSPRVVRIRA
ncbi:MAG: HNH endonuclease [Candidatus Nanopelagicales bacterium]